MAVSPVKQAMALCKSSIKGRLDGAYQYEGVKWMLQKELGTDPVKGGFLADDMGLGKTFQAIAVICGNPLPTLIITEVSTVGQWRNALSEFGQINPFILTSSFSGNLIPADTKVVLTTYSVFQRPKGAPNCLLNCGIQRVILDEGHNIRNHKTKLYAEISKLQCPIKWILSATPIQNSTKDIVNQAKWIGISDTTVDDIFAKHVLRRTQFAEGQRCPRLKLPDLQCDIVKLEFKHDAERELYTSVEKEYAAKLEEMMGDNEYCTIMEGILRCRQVCIHPQLYYEGIARKPDYQPPKRARTEKNTAPITSSTKIQYICDYVRQHANEKTLVFCHWRTEMGIIKKELEKMNIGVLLFDGRLNQQQRENVLYNYNNTSIPVLVLQIDCGSSGLNLQCASNVVITNPSWNPTVEVQAICRAHRKGQNQNVRCVRLVMANTIEERCLEVSGDKLDLIADAMRDDLIKTKLGCEKYSPSDIRYIFTKMKL